MRQRSRRSRPATPPIFCCDCGLEKPTAAIHPPWLAARPPAASAVSARPMDQPPFFAAMRRRRRGERSCAPPPRCITVGIATAAISDRPRSPRSYAWGSARHARVQISRGGVAASGAVGFRRQCSLRWRTNLTLGPGKRGLQRCPDPHAARGAFGNRDRHVRLAIVPPGLAIPSAVPRNVKFHRDNHRPEMGTTPEGHRRI